MKYMTLLLILLLSLVLLCFLYLNQGLVTIQYFPGEGYQTPPIPIFAIIMLGIIAGVLMAGVIGFGEQLRLRLRNRQLSRQVNRLEAELALLKPAVGTGEESVTTLPSSSGPGEKPLNAEAPKLSFPGADETEDAVTS